LNVFVVGCNGYIGKTVVESLQGSEITVKAVSSHPTSDMLFLDLLDTDCFSYSQIKIGDVVFVAAAISAPDICANEHDLAWAVNVTGTSDFITKVMEQGGRVILFSSDTVYGERDKEFDDQASCNPAGEYAVMKHEVEKRYIGNPLFKAIRLSYVFSQEDKFTKYLTGCADGGEEAEIYHPFYRAVIHRDDVVDGAIALAQRWGEFPQNIINFGGPDVLARTEYAKIMQDEVLPNLRFRVTEPDADYFKNRPRVIRMTSPVLTSLLGRSAHTLREAARIEFERGKEHD